MSTKMDAPEEACPGLNTSLKTKTQDINSRYLEKGSEHYEQVLWKLMRLIKEELEDVGWATALKVVVEDESQKKLERLESVRKERAR